MPVIDVEGLIQNRVHAVREYHETTGIRRAQLDVSGGVDSAVMLGLLAKAVGPENITAVYSDIDSSGASEDRAEETALTFGVKLACLDLSLDFDNLVELCELHARDLAARGEKDLNKYLAKKQSITDRMKADPTILGSFRSCIRAPIGRFMNRLMGNGIRHGTGNECEDRWLRFYQKGGDGEVDTNPLAMLSKGEVYQLAIGLGVPHSVLAAVPSPDLQGTGDAHNDEDELRALTGVDWTYSRVYLEDAALGDKFRNNQPAKRGEYASVGTIEKLSRMADKYNSAESDERFFLDGIDPVETLCLADKNNTPFHNVTDEELKTYISSARKIERNTRHKMNPNCPSLGNRYELIDIGIITNELPKL